MLKDKLSHLAILDEQLERLQKSANEISAITGHDIESVEGAIVSLLTPHNADEKACRADHDAFHRMRHCPKFCPECGERLRS